MLYGVETHIINYNIKKIYSKCELFEDEIIRKFRAVQTEEGQQIDYYGLQLH